MTRSIIIGAFAVIIILGVLISSIALFRYITRSSGVVRPKLSPLPTASKEVFKTIAGGNIVGLRRTAGGTALRYFDTSDGRMKEVNFSGDASRTISEVEFKNVFAIHWSPQSDQTILEYAFEPSDKPATGPIPSAIHQLTFFDLASATTTDLNPFIRSLDWSPDGKKIIYHYRDDASNENFIAISNPNGSEQKIILNKAQFLSVKLYWVSPELVLLEESPSPGMETLLMALELPNNTLRIISRGKYGTSILPSPDGKKNLMSYTSDADGRVLITEIVDTSGMVLKTLPFVTLAEKCAWGADSETIYCAVPEIPYQTDGLPYRYWTGEVYSRDKLLSYKFTTGEQKSITDGAINADIVDLVVSKGENAFGFINRFTGKLSIFTR
jgi:hypothetical protein